jgi:stage V sporulation protein G
MAKKNNRTPAAQEKEDPNQTVQAAAPAKEMPPVHLDVRVRPITPMGNLMGYASATLNGCFAVDDIKIVSGKNGLFASMPSVKDGNGQYKDVCFPVTAEFRQQLQQAVVAGYHQALQRMQEAAQQAQQQQEQAAPASMEHAMAV